MEIEIFVVLYNQVDKNILDYFIIKDAHQYILPFKNKQQEDLISVMVLKKYFQETRQF